MSTAQPMDHEDARATVAHPAPERARASLAVLWFGLFGAPAAWTAQTLVNLPVAAHACFPRLEPLAVPTLDVRDIVLVVSLAAVVTAALALLVAWRAWTRTRHEHHAGSGAGQAHPHDAALLETGEGRTRFMALAGVLTSATFLLVTLLHGATLLLVRPCGH